MKDTLQEYLNAQPFSPFYIHLTSGRDVEITHPEAATLLPHRIQVSIGWKPDHTANTQESINYLHVASVREKGPVASD